MIVAIAAGIKARQNKHRDACSSGGTGQDAGKPRHGQANDDAREYRVDQRLDAKFHAAQVDHHADYRAGQGHAQQKEGRALHIRSSKQKRHISP